MAILSFVFLLGYTSDTNVAWGGTDMLITYVLRPFLDLFPQLMKCSNNIGYRCYSRHSPCIRVRSTAQCGTQALRTNNALGLNPFRGVVFTLLMVYKCRHTLYYFPSIVTYSLCTNVTVNWVSIFFDKSAGAVLPLMFGLRVVWSLRY